MYAVTAQIHCGTGTTGVMTESRMPTQRRRMMRTAANMNVLVMIVGQECQIIVLIVYISNTVVVITVVETRFAVRTVVAHGTSTRRRSPPR